MCASVFRTSPEVEESEACSAGSPPVVILASVPTSTLTVQLPLQAGEAELVTLDVFPAIVTTTMGTWERTRLLVTTERAAVIAPSTAGAAVVLWTDSPVSVSGGTVTAADGDVWQFQPQPNSGCNCGNPVRRAQSIVPYRTGT
jgi:hypothetical protein